MSRASRMPLTFDFSQPERAGRFRIGVGDAGIVVQKTLKDCFYKIIEIILWAMRYDINHKSQTRRKILESAARQFRARGTESVRVVDIMQDAGMTHGGFYKHFADKDQLFIAALRTAFDRTAEKIESLTKGSSGMMALSKVIRFYLSEDHLRHPDIGCAFAALGTDMARLPRSTKIAVNASLDAYAERLSHLMPGDTPVARRAAFLTLFPAMAGYLIAARVHVSRVRQREILLAGRDFLEKVFCRDYGLTTFWDAK